MAQISDVEQLIWEQVNVITDLRARLDAVENVCAEASGEGNHLLGVSFVLVPRVLRAARGEAS